MLLLTSFKRVDLVTVSVSLGLASNSNILLIIAAATYNSKCNMTISYMNDEICIETLQKKCDFDIEMLKANYTESYRLPMTSTIIYNYSQIK